MQVSDILRLKGQALYTITPEDSLADAARLMADEDIGSLVVLSHGRVVGMLTFREVIQATKLDEVRRMMLSHHARYLPVIENRELVGVVSFHDVAKAVVDSQDFENGLLKAYIRDWPAEDGQSGPGVS